MRCPLPPFPLQVLLDDLYTLRLRICLFRCPACQEAYPSPPAAYFCFCGNARDPKDDAYLAPHSCGEPCHRLRATTKCPHPCQLLCHPGPCAAVRACRAVRSSVRGCGCVSLHWRTLVLERWAAWKPCWSVRRPPMVPSYSLWWSRWSPKKFPGGPQ